MGDKNNIKKTFGGIGEWWLHYSDFPTSFVTLNNKGKEKRELKYAKTNQ